MLTAQCMLSHHENVRTPKFWHKSKENNQIFLNIDQGHWRFWLRTKNQHYHRRLCTFNFADLTHANLNSYSLKPYLKIKLPFVSDSRWKSGGPSRSSLGLLLDPSNCSCQVNNDGERRLCLTGFFGIVNHVGLQKLHIVCYLWTFATMGKDVSCNCRDCNVNIGFRIFAKKLISTFRKTFAKTLAKIRACWLLKKWRIFLNISDWRILLLLLHRFTHS